MPADSRWILPNPKLVRLNARHVAASERMPEQTTAHLTTDDNLNTSVNAMNLEYRLGDIDTDCRYRLHGSLR